MTIEKAKETLEYLSTDPWMAPKGNLADAINLAIEALKFKQAWKQGRYFPAAHLLPGETIED